MRLLNVIDVEATCWPGDPPSGQVSEIIEVGLAVIDLDSGKRLGKHDILVRPENSDVSEFCTKLTGWTQAEIETGISFAAACEQLASEYGSRPWASWGDYDRRQFERQCAGSGYPFGPVHHNAKAIYAQARRLRKRPGMAAALKMEGMQLEGRHHRGEDDAWNIAALILRLNNDGHWPAG